MISGTGERGDAEPRRPNLLPRPSAPVAAVLFFGFASLSALVYLFAPWQPKADFDMIGVLYVMQNAAPLFVFALASAATTVALGLWIEAVRENKRAGRRPK